MAEQTASAARVAAQAIIRNAESVFIVYSHADLKLAKKIYVRLKNLRREKPDDSMFLDQEGLTPGTRVTPQEVEDRLRATDLVIVLCGKNTADRPIVREEVAIALEREAAGKARILPIILRSGVRLPDGLDYEVQAIFLTVLFPDFRWERLIRAGAGVILLSVFLAVLGRAGWAIRIAPTEGWTIIEVTESGFESAILAVATDGTEKIRTTRRSTETGRFAEDVDNSNDLFLEFDLDGVLTGALAYSHDDAGTFPDPQRVAEYGGMGSLASLQPENWDDRTRGVQVWAQLAQTSARATLVGYDDGLEDLLYELSREFERVNDKTQKVYRLGPETVLAFIPDEGFKTALAILWDKGAAEVSASVPFREGGICMLAKKPGTTDELYMTKGDTRWEDEGSASGVLRSEDSGQNWQWMDLGEGTDEFDIFDVTAGLGSSPRIAVSYSETEGGTFGVLISDDEGTQGPADGANAWC